MSCEDIPVACTLTAEELPARRERLARIGREIEHVEERENGYTYRFATDAILMDLMEIVKAERLCCPFLRFSIVLEPGNGSLWIEISGPEGTKEFLSSFFAESH
jgi:hypothetical protein